MTEADSDTISRAKAIEALMNALNDVGVLDAEDINTVFQMLPPSQLGTNLAEVGTDCISREQAIEICDHAIDLLKGQFGAGALVAIKESIEELPPAQPEIIRCKDCKHRDPEDKKCDCGHDIEWQLPRQDDWFCADAER